MPKPGKPYAPVGATLRIGCGHRWTVRPWLVMIRVMEEASSPIVGRDSELAAVDAFLSTARTRCAVLALEGEPGIGKTTLWLEALQRARGRGTRVLLTHPSEAEATLSYAALADIFDTVSNTTVSALAVPQREAITAALLRSSPPRGGIDERALCASVLSLLRLLSAEEPLLVAVDDAQWLDSPSARVLSYAVRRLEDEAVGFLVTSRVRGVSPPLRFDRASDPSRHHSVVVGALSVAALHELIKQHTGRSLPRPTLVQVAGICGGNPFYALEIAASLPDGPLEGGRLRVPASLTELVVARLARLPAATRRALLVASALSHPTIDLVDFESLGAAQRAGIVSIEQGRIQFAHPLLASAVYDQADEMERRRLHRHLAGVVTEPEERARHAALGASEPAIAGKLEEAAVLARSRGAPGAAAELLDLAVGLTPPSGDGDRAARLVAGAGFWFDTGDLVRAQATIDRAIAAPIGDRLRARALHLMGQIDARRSSFTRASAVAYQGLEAAAGDAELATDLELDLAYYSVSLGDLPGAEGHARRAVVAAERAGVQSALADALAVVTIAEFIGGRGLDEDRMRRALELEDPTRNRAWQMSPTFIHGSLLLYTGRVDQAFAVLDGLHSATLERGEESMIPFLCFYMVWVCLWRGDLIAADRLALEARQTAALLDDPAANGIALAASALVHAHDGSSVLARQEALESIRGFEALDWALGTAWPLWALGLAMLSSGDPAAVDAALGPLAAMVTGAKGGDTMLAVFLPDEIEALVELGQIDRAVGFVEWLEQRGAALDRPWALAAAGRCRGLLCASRGDVQGAIAALEAALVQHDRTGMPFERARTLLVLGRVQRRSNMRGQARATLDEALSLFEHFGAEEWAARVRGELERLGRRAESPEALTPTEARVAELAASGLPNREIAERAFLTTKAVEANLTRVYRKLGIRSRGGLARALQAVREASTPAG
jgi:DNA-binding CsgD family transcriptional regulator